MFFKKRKQAQMEQEQKAREEKAAVEAAKNAARLKNKIEMGSLLLDRCPDYKFEVNPWELEAVLAAFPVEEYELKIEERGNYYAGWRTYYYIVKKKKEEKQ